MYLCAQRCEIAQNAHPRSHFVTFLWFPLQSHPPNVPKNANGMQESRLTSTLFVPFQRKKVPPNRQGREGEPAVSEV